MTDGPDRPLTGRVYESLGPRAKRTYLKESVERRLEVPRRFLDEHYPNNAALRDGLAAGGLKKEHLDALRAVLEPAEAAADAQVAAYQGARKASETLKVEMPAAETAYGEVFRRGTSAGKLDAAVRAALDVGRKERNRTQRLAQMRRFLSAAEGERAALDGFGLTDAHVASARAALASAEATDARWVRLTEEAEKATRDRNALMGPLDEAMQGVQERGKSGMPEERDLLELLGLPPG